MKALNLFRGDLPANHMSRSLIVLPDDSAKPILDAIEEAKDSLRIKMFVLSDPHLMRALVSAHRRGIQVKIMLNPERRFLHLSHLRVAEESQPGSRSLGPARD
jgi:phosphatidylserine/phosphatidylglycerophosphate/cardiolipin synthase-like enzyme